ncbi:glycosyltransferase family 2 protein [Robertkochia aurantiaca]|uniref:glycosyltransferase family 2 protein n=1 Tax=Robertkochia aurantiaca TaxID=2873700 RepID=UPI0021031BD4|nr:glycosyltransferase family 2 protein [Robertkochia sp. 3YJGBD-33]
MKRITVALVISTYNWSEALELVLRSVLKQSVLPDEILIADDGSDCKTRELIASYQGKFETGIQHIWHEDKGFRKSIILNRAIASAESDYIIQVDGDCFLHSRFIEDHLDSAKERMYLYGTRVRIKEEKVPEIIGKKELNIHFFKSGLKKRPRNIRVPVISELFRPQETISPKFRGCNTSFWRKDFLAVNGYNEDLEGWGREDSELMIRMHNRGVLGKRLKFNGIVYHLDHREESKERFDINDSIQRETLENKKDYCENGVNKYLKVD